MTDFFRKTIDEITIDDILSLRDTPEGQLFEIKSTLATESGELDSWFTPPERGKTRDGPGDYAKQNVFKELVAFANSDGGWLILGLDETFGKGEKGLFTGQLESRRPEPGG